MIRMNKWKGVITNNIYQIGDEYTTIKGIKRRITRIKTIIANNGSKYYYLINNVGAQLEQVIPI